MLSNGKGAEALGIRSAFCNTVEVATGDDSLIQLYIVVCMKLRGIEFRGDRGSSR